MVYERQQDVAREADIPNTLVPLTDYGLSKLVGERLSKAFAAQYGLAYTIWRPFNIIGLHERAEGSDPGVCHVFVDFIQQIVHEQQNPMLVLGTGRQVRCFTWIGDIADAIADFSFAPESRNGEFNLGNPEPVSMLDLARRIYSLYGELTGRTDLKPLTFTHQSTYADDVQIRIPDVSRARDDLGWAPTVSLDQMLRRVVGSALPEAVV
jgi:nucleoside-diphosphate-sugar epimerase